MLEEDPSTSNAAPTTFLPPRDTCYLFKVILIGNSGVGKSNVLSRFTRNELLPDHNTIGVEFATKHMLIDDKLVKAQFWDTAGQERFKALGTAYYRGAIGAIFVYDITDLGSFQNIHQWLTDFRRFAQEDVVTMLVGNKLDLADKRAVQFLHAQNYAHQQGMLFLETSAVSAEFVDDAFTTIIRGIYQHLSSTGKLDKTVQRESISRTEKIPVRIVEPHPSFIAQVHHRKCCHE